LDAWKNPDNFPFVHVPDNAAATLAFQVELDRQTALKQRNPSFLARNIDENFLVHRIPFVYLFVLL